MFKNMQDALSDTWQAFERNICRFLIYSGYTNVRLVGQTNDHGADIIANAPSGRRCVVQSKHWKRPVGKADVDYTISAMQTYDAELPIVVSLSGYDQEAIMYKAKLQADLHVPIQLWSASDLVERTTRLPEYYANNGFSLREYQETACREVVSRYHGEGDRRGLVVLATGLGKTVVAAEAIRRIRHLIADRNRSRVLILAHTNPLVEQLDRSFWKFIGKSDSTMIWNSNETHSSGQLANADFVFACVDTVANSLHNGIRLPRFEIVLVDECHHVGSATYTFVIESLNAGRRGGPFLIGLSATPWRADEVSPRQWFGDPLVCVDMVEGMRKGYLANVDYRMYTSNIDWAKFSDPRNQGRSFSVKQLNRTIFVNEWNDAILEQFQLAYKEQRPFVRAVVFCATIYHARLMAAKINALRFCSAKALYSGVGKCDGQNNFERNKILSDFADGRLNVICTVDIFNEGLDVPDVNLIVFNRTTHSRRIFVQQLGRGLRLSVNKSKVIVLDFVSDVRRIAASIVLEKSLKMPCDEDAKLVSINHKVTFRRAGGEEDPRQESFLKKWLCDIAETAKDCEEEESFLRFPPIEDVPL